LRGAHAKAHQRNRNHATLLEAEMLFRLDGHGRLDVSDTIIDAFIDDAGNTGNELNDPEQRNLFLGCVVVPETRATAFWLRAAPARRIASSVAGISDEVELKGADLFGRKGPFKGVEVADRRRVLDALVEAVVTERIYFFWQGVPKHYWPLIVSDPRKVPFWRTVLITFCHQAYTLFDRLYGPHPFRITVDEHPTFPAGYLLDAGTAAWPSLIDSGIIFRRSCDERGLQVADVLTHAIYRANKAACPNPALPPVVLSRWDELAASYVRQLSEAGVVFNLTTALEQFVTD
jgi:hypothetical protein